MSDFKSVKRNLDNRNIRAHDFEENNFNVSFTDSSCPLTEIANQIREPGKHIHFAQANDERIIRLLRKGGTVVDSDVLPSYNRFSLKKRDPEDTRCIQTGDLIAMSFDEKLVQKSQEVVQQQASDRVMTALKTVDRSHNSARNPLNPFSSY